jgi:acyl transferase domain-containing protein
MEWPADVRVRSGASKANFGHLEGASGILGLIKAVLVLERGIIPRVAGVEKVNESEFDAESLKIKVS